MKLYRPPNAERPEGKAGFQIGTAPCSLQTGSERLCRFRSHVPMAVEELPPHAEEGEARARRSRGRQVLRREERSIGRQIVEPTCAPHGVGSSLDGLCLRMLPTKSGEERPELAYPPRPALSAESTPPGGIEVAEVQSGGACLGDVAVLKTPERMWMVLPSMSEIEGVRPANGVRCVMEPRAELLPHRLRCIEVRPQLEVGIERRSGQKGRIQGDAVDRSHALGEVQHQLREGTGPFHQCRAPLKRRTLSRFNPRPAPSEVVVIEREVGAGGDAGTVGKHVMNGDGWVEGLYPQPRKAPVTGASRSSRPAS